MLCAEKKRVRNEQQPSAAMNGGCPGFEGLVRLRRVLEDMLETTTQIFSHSWVRSAFYACLRFTEGPQASITQALTS